MRKRSFEISVWARLDPTNLRGLFLVIHSHTEFAFGNLQSIQFRITIVRTLINQQDKKNISDIKELTK